MTTYWKQTTTVFLLLFDIMFNGHAVFCSPDKRKTFKCRVQIRGLPEAEQNREKEGEGRVTTTAAIPNPIIVLETVLGSPGGFPSACCRMVSSSYFFPCMNV